MEYCSWLLALSMRCTYVLFQTSLATILVNPKIFIKNTDVESPCSWLSLKRAVGVLTTDGSTQITRLEVSREDTTTHLRGRQSS